MTRSKIQTAVFLLWFLSFLSVGTAGTIYVSPGGDDGADGSEESPFRTISRAARAAMPGDTVLVKEGVYRERVAPPRSGEEGKPIVFMGEPGKRVFVKGSEIWKPRWEHLSEGVYYAVPDDALFDDRSPEYVDHYNPFKVQLASTPHQREGRREKERGYGGDPDLVYTCGQVFVNGKWFTEVPFKKELEPETWFYEPDSERIYVDFGRFDPRNQVVEITTRRRIFAPVEKGLGHIVVTGFVFEHAGNQYPTNFWNTDAYAQKGAVGLEAGHHWTIRRNVIRFAKTFALDAGTVDRHGKGFSANDNLIEQNYIIENGSAGILSCGSKNLVIRDNVILYNNTLGFLGSKRWEQAGIKCHNFKNGYIHNNYIAHNNLTYGIWLDNQFPDSRVSRNVLVDNGRAGLFLEMSDYDFDRVCVDNNIMLGNRENPVYIHDASGATFLHNLFANTPRNDERGGGVHIRQVTERTRSRCHSFFNNLFIGNDRLLDVNYPAFRGGPQKFDYNVYDAGAADRKFSVNKKSDQPAPWDDEEFIEKIHAELGDASPGTQILDGHGKANLTFEEWKVFWGGHGLENDAHSQLRPGSTVSYNSRTHQLTLDISFDPKSIGFKNHAFLGIDYFGNPIRRETNAVPGPFQNLKKGRQTVKIWDGPPIVRKGELPDFAE